MIDIRKQLETQNKQLLDKEKSILIREQRVAKEGNNIKQEKIKTSWELDSFMPKLIEEADRSYIAQLNVYFDLTGAKSGAIAYCLVSAPINILESEKKALLWRMNVISEESPEYLRAVEEMTKLMVFDGIDYRERVIKIPVIIVTGKQ